MTLSLTLFLVAPVALTVLSGTDGVLWLVIVLAPWIELLAIVLAAGVLLSRIRARNRIWHAVVLFVTLADLALLVIAGRAIG